MFKLWIAQCFIENLCKRILYLICSILKRENFACLMPYLSSINNISINTISSYGQKYLQLICSIFDNLSEDISEQ